MSIENDTRCFIGANEGGMKVFFLRDLKVKFEVSEDGKFVTVQFGNLGQPFSLYSNVEELIDELMTSASNSYVRIEKIRLESWLKSAAEVNLNLSKKIEKSDPKQAAKYVEIAALLLSLNRSIYRPVPKKGILPHVSILS